MSDYVVVVLVVLIVCTDVLAIRHIMRSDVGGGMKVVYALQSRGNR